MYLLRQNVEQIKDLLENNIDMNKKYLTQLASEKEKLAFKTEKVELAIIDDAKKALENFVDLRKKAADDIDEAYVFIRRIEKAATEAKGRKSLVSSYANDLRKAEGEVVKIIDKATAAAKELGVDIYSTKLIDFSKFNNTITLSDNLQEDAKLFVNFINKLPNFNL